MACDPQLANVEADAILDQVFSQIRLESFKPHHGSAVRFYSGPALGSTRTIRKSLIMSDNFAEIARRLHTSLYAGVDAGIPRIGESPPRSTTLRGLWGAFAIRVIQRLLWWYTRSLQVFAASIGEQFHSELAALESLALAQEATRAELEELREEVQQLRSSLSGGGNEN